MNDLTDLDFPTPPDFSTLEEEPVQAPRFKIGSERIRAFFLIRRPMRKFSMTAKSLFALIAGLVIYAACSSSTPELGPCMPIVSVPAANAVIPSLLGITVPPAQPTVVEPVVLRGQGASPLFYYKKEGVAFRWAPAQSPPKFKPLKVALKSAVCQGEDCKEGKRLNLTGPGPTLVNIAAKHCGPCIREFHEVLNLGSLINQQSAGASRLVFLFTDEAARGPKSLAVLVQDFISENQKLKPSTATAALEPWMEFRGDPESKILAAIDSYCQTAPGACPGYDSGSIPVTLLLDHCGNIHRLVQGELSRAAISELATTAKELDPKAKCGVPKRPKPKKS